MDATEGENKKRKVLGATLESIVQRRLIRYTDGGTA